MPFARKAPDDTAKLAALDAAAPVGGTSDDLGAIGAALTRVTAAVGTTREAARVLAR